MIEQHVAHGSMKGWRGVALIGAVALVVILGSNFFYFLSRYIGNAASPMFIAFGMAVAWFLLNRYVMGFAYYFDGSCLRVRRTYGRYQRQVADVWLNGVKACGTLEEVRRRCPGARLQRAVKPECPIEPLAVAFNDAGKTAILLLQPEGKLRDVILGAVKGKQGTGNRQQ